MPVGFAADRRRASRACFILVLTSAVVASMALDVFGQNPAPRGRLGQGVPLYEPVLDTPPRDSAPVENPTGSVTLRDAIALALLQNPALASFAWETRAREARLLQSGARPNPALSVEVADYGAPQLAGGGINEAVQPQTTVQLSQLVELGGKRAARQRLAALNRDLSAWDYEAARIDVLTAVSRTFTDVLAAQETVGQMDQTMRVVEQVQQSAAARVTAGVVSPIEETRAGVAVGAVRIDVLKARRSLEAHRVRLAALWGSPTPVFSRVEGDLRKDLAPLPPLATLVSMLKDNPDLARWNAEIQQREAALRVERAKRVPDVSVIGGYRRFTNVDSNAFLVGATVSLPLFDKNRGAVQEAQMRLARSYEDQRAVEASVTTALAGAYAALASAYDEATTLQSTVLPGSQQAFDAISEGYRLGRFNFLDVLESQRTVVGAGAQVLRALADYFKAVTEVERLIGAPLSETAGPSTTRE